MSSIKVCVSVLALAFGGSSLAACGGNAIVITRGDASATADVAVNDTPTVPTIMCHDGIVYTSTSCTGACPAGQVRGVTCNADRTGFESCGCYGQTIADGGVQPLPPPCTNDGVVYISTMCTGACPAGQTRGVVCNADRTGFGGCGCYGVATVAVDGGTPPVCVIGEVRQMACRTCGTNQNAVQTCVSGQWADCRCVDQAPPAGTMCVTGAVQLMACRTCASNQNATMTCVNGSWADCRCVDQAPGGGDCVPNSITTNSCATCQAGYTARQVCRPDGRGYNPCECALSPVNEICTATNQRVCPAGTEVTCGTNQVARQTCSNDGRQWSACQCVSNGTTTVCVPNQDVAGGGCSCASNQTSRQTCNSAGSAYNACYCVNNVVAQACTPGSLGAPTSCSSSCGVNQTMRQQCNAAGTGYTGDCQCVTSTSTGGTGSTGGCGGGTLIVRAANTSQRVRCWGNAQTWTSSTNELRQALDGNQCGYSECVTGTIASNGQFVEDAYWSGQRAGSITAMISFAGVEGRDSGLVNQTNVARNCVDTRNRTKAVIAVNIDRLGLCQ